MNFRETFETASVILNDGALVERLRRDPDFEIDPHIAHASALYAEKGRAILERLLREYIETGQRYDLPLALSAPTFRASPERAAKSGFGDAGSINRDAIRFLADIRKDYGAYAAKVYIAGIVGCKGDAYKPEEALEAEEAARYHRAQADALAEAGADALFAYTLPAAKEALGIAQALAACGLPYAVSFVLRPSGALLDGTPLRKAIRMIDEQTEPRPLFFMSNCCHSSVFDAGLTANREAAATISHRMQAFKANTSPKSPEELDGMEELQSEDPEIFGEAMARLHQKHGIKMLGGCCGTDNRHLEALAARLSAIARRNQNGL